MKKILILAFITGLVAMLMSAVPVLVKHGESHGRGSQKIGAIVSGHWE